MAQQHTAEMHQAKLAECSAYAIKRKEQTGHNYFVDSNFCVLLDEPFSRKQSKRFLAEILFSTAEV